MQTFILVCKNADASALMLEVSIKYLSRQRGESNLVDLLSGDALNLPLLGFDRVVVQDSRRVSDIRETKIGGVATREDVGVTIKGTAKCLKLL